MTASGVSDDEGGEAPCWLHELDAMAEAGRLHTDAPAAVVVDLGARSTAGASGVVWALEASAELNANVVKLDPGHAIGEHVNGEVDVFVYVLSGDGSVTIDGRTSPLAADHAVLVPRGARRSVRAGATTLLYLSVHRRRGPLQVAAR